MTATTTEFNDVLDRVREWPAEQRLSLAQSVLASVSEPLLQASADDVISAMKARYPRLFAQSDTQKLHAILDNATSDRPPPTDAEVKQWIDEHRMEKYGS
jgi:hypothetical protein